MEEIEVGDYAEVRDSGVKHLLLDVREPKEWQICHVEGATLVPLGSLQARLGELAAWKDQPVYVMCHHGGRSAQAARFLAGNGFAQVTNIAGGIHEWALQVDPQMRTY